MNPTALLVIGTLAAGASGGQQPPAPAPQQGPAALRPAPDPRRQDVQIMEVALTRALRVGAQELAQLMKVSEPTSAFVTENGRARGFVLEGYGIFFDVDVPGMKQSAVWSSQVAQLARERANTLQLANAMAPNDPRQSLAVARLNQIDRYIRAAQAGQVLLPPAPSPTEPAQIAAPDGMVGAASVNESVIVTSGGDARGSSAALSMLPDMQVRDPNELYTEAVKKALIDAMLDYSKLLKLAENEWLTVAASDGDRPAPGQLDDSSRILISIRGSDLLALQANKLTREDVLKKVVVKEF